MYLIRNTFRAQRGKAPVLFDLFKGINQMLTS
jgi:hypothetical protein